MERISIQFIGKDLLAPISRVTTSFSVPADSIPTTHVLGGDEQGNDMISPCLIRLRDKAIITAMLYTFARVGAMVAMTVAEDYPQVKRA